MVTTIGWINVAFVAVMASIYPFKKAYMKKMKSDGKEKAENLKKVYQFIRKLHPKLGIVILLIGLYHGSQAFSLTVLHTGTLLLYTILVMAVIGLSGPRVKAFRKNWRTVHRTIGLFVILFVFLHIFQRNLI